MMLLLLQELWWNLCRYVHACVHGHWCAKLQTVYICCICLLILKNMNQVEPSNIFQLVNLAWRDHVHIYLMIWRKQLMQTAFLLGDLHWSFASCCCVDQLLSSSQEINCKHR
jgi:hypothetical protein